MIVAQLYSGAFLPIGTKMLIINLSEILARPVSQFKICPCKLSFLKARLIS